VYTTLEDTVVVEPVWTTTTLPPPAPIDRFALRVGEALIHWSRQHALRADRLEQARLSGAADRAATARLATAERRFAAGPRW
jgi:hypothetical protein